MRIGYDAKRYYLNKSGLGNYSRDLIRILENYYPENNYLKYTPKINGSSLADDSLKLPKGRINFIFPSYWRSKGIVNDLLTDQIDIYHGLSGEIPRGLQKTRIKSVVTIHDLIFLKHPELYKPIDRFLYNKKFSYAVHHADKIIAISEQTKKDIIEYYQISADKIEVIYQGCHPAFKTEKSEQEKESIRKKYNLPDRFLLNVGSIEPRKNALQIIRAIEQIDIPLIIIGKETPYAKKIQQYVVSKGLQNRVYIRQGFTMEELATIYSMADIFIYPSKYEGFGIPIIEALYSGTPVITTNSGVFPEAGGPNSYYVNPEQVEEITNAINLILSDSTLRSRMIQEGLNYVQRFNDDKLASQWNTVYQHLLAT